MVLPYGSKVPTIRSIYVFGNRNCGWGSVLDIWGAWTLGAGV